MKLSVRQRHGQPVELDNIIQSEWLAILGISVLTLLTESVQNKADIKKPAEPSGSAGKIVFYLIITIICLNMTRYLLDIEYLITEVHDYLCSLAAQCCVKRINR